VAGVGHPAQVAELAVLQHVVRRALESDHSSEHRGAQSQDERSVSDARDGCTAARAVACLLQLRARACFARQARHNREGGEAGQATADPARGLHEPRAGRITGVEAVVVDRARRSGADGTSQAGWKVCARRRVPSSGTVRVSRARRSEWGGARQSADEVIKGTMDDQIRRSGPRRAFGQQPRTERGPL
jgi:hypothetical protein